jgi:uncharacterized protein (TIGR03118 family)
MLAATPAFKVTNLVSDGTIPALHTDSNLVDAWGIAFNPAHNVVWIANNGTGTSTVYNPDGTAVAISGSSNAVTIPPPAGSSAIAAPDGEIFNTTSSFTVSKGGTSGPAAYIWSTEDGTISAWNPTVDLNNAILEVDDSSSNAVFKGLAMAKLGGSNLIYATDFRNDRIDAFDSAFKQVTLPFSFSDSKIPAGFAPFNITNIGGDLVVTYAKQDSAKHDDVAGLHNGFVDIYAPDGKLVERVVAGGQLDSPWGVATAPAGFGALAGDLLIGNFGNGRILAFNTKTRHFDGLLTHRGGTDIKIDGLWGLTFGDTAATADTLFFTAGPDAETHGLFGTISLVSAVATASGGGSGGAYVPPA